ncbi:hypothetical protein RND81_13G051300 [Saponaria officinalis]|uniref:Bet v I/Major latex protein domain-containing protein n=1 Tax=Saponaria officinalis TaxID=3572 RepID=A0AAW1GW74_SAPOF
MGVFGTMGIEVDIKHPGDVFHKLFGSNPHKVSDFVPDHVHGCDIHEGEFGKPGSIIQWEYTLNGKKSIAREVVEAIDEENKMAKFRLIEGSEILKDYKSMTISLHVIPKGEYDAVMWKVDFERFEDHGPYPTDIIDFFITMTRGIEAHHISE